MLTTIILFAVLGQQIRIADSNYLDPPVTIKTIQIIGEREKEDEKAGGETHKSPLTNMRGKVIIDNESPREYSFIMPSDPPYPRRLKIVVGRFKRDLAPFVGIDHSRVEGLVGTRGNEEYLYLDMIELPQRGPYVPPDRGAHAPWGNWGRDSTIPRKNK